MGELQASRCSLCEEALAQQFKCQGCAAARPGGGQGQSPLGHWEEDYQAAICWDFPPLASGPTCPLWSPVPAFQERKAILDLPLPSGV